MNNAKAANARTIGPVTHAVASELRAELARQKRSAKNLAETNGLNRSTLHKTLNAQRAIDVDDLYQLAGMLGVDPAELYARAAHIASAQMLAEAIAFPTAPLDRGSLSTPTDVGGHRDDYGLVANDTINETADDPDAGYDNA